MAEPQSNPPGCTPLLRLLEPIVTARVLVVAAHPDDETIGAGALLARSIDANVIVITDGAPRDRAMWPAGVNAATREEYAHIRREELRLALAEAGIGFERVHLLDVADCEVTQQIPAIVNRLVQLLETIDPDIVLTHAYEGGHVDHDATALCVHAALALTGRGHPHEMALYHGADSGIAVHEFLPGGPAVRTVELDERLRTRKSSMLARYQSQPQYAGYFGTDVERYRCAPDYDFRQSPDPNRPVLYEQNAGMSGDEWRARAQAAIEELKLPKPESATAVSHIDPSAPLVSVIVRTVGRDTLTQALDSIASQTYRNLEIVLVDVGGQGPPVSWQDREGRVLRTCTSPGFDRPKAANVGLDAATGDYIAFLDDDDWFHPEHIASLVTALRGAADARVAYAGVEVVEWLSDASPTRRWVFDARYDPVSLLCENYIPLNGVLFERRLRDEGARFDEALPLYEDWDFLIWLSRRTRFEKAQGITAVYRWPPGSGVTDPSRTGVSQERVFTKWRSELSREEHIALMRRAIEQTALNDGRKAQLEALETHLKAQDAELQWLRSHVATQERELEQFRRHLKAQDDELGHLRPNVANQDRQMEKLRAHLKAQDEELERLRPCVTAQETQLQELRPHLTRQDQELEELREVSGRRDLELSDARHRLQTQDQELAVLRLRVSTQAEDVRRLTDACAAADAQLAVMLKSRSWRLTQPLRALRAWVFSPRSFKLPW